MSQLEKNIYCENFSINAADSSLGAEVIFCTDEFFAPAYRILLPTEPKFLPDYYDENGKWMDGWETKRRRSTGFDCCIIKLAYPCLVKKICIETTYFTGNSPMAISVDSLYSDKNLVVDTRSGWVNMLGCERVDCNSINEFSLSTNLISTHIKLNIYPDGGIARIKVFGDIQRKLNYTSKENDKINENLLCISNGAKVIACSDNHYGSPINLLKSTPAINMGDGWETRRRRTPGNDWCIFSLFNPGEINAFELDTSFFKGNYPSHCSIQGLTYTKYKLPQEYKKILIYESMFWDTLVPKIMVAANNQLKISYNDKSSYTHIRLNIYPDGGLSRFKVWGKFNEW
jgi:allantoicase